MSIEIEAKMRLADPGPLQQLLSAHQATWEGRIFETNTVFDREAGELKSEDRGLRIRVEQQADQPPTVTLTHKGPRGHGWLKSRRESEVRVDDAHRAADLLTALGYRPVLTFEKRRQRWTIEGCRVELDTLPLIGDFIEIEGPSDEAVLAVRQKLALAETPLVGATYAAMLTAYIHEHDLRTTLVRFEEAAATAASLAPRQTATD